MARSAFPPDDRALKQCSSSTLVPKSVPWNRTDWGLWGWSLHQGATMYELLSSACFWRCFSSTHPNVIKCQDWLPALSWSSMCTTSGLRRRSLFVVVSTARDVLVVMCIALGSGENDYAKLCLLLWSSCKQDTMALSLAVCCCRLRVQRIRVLCSHVSS